MNAFNELTPGSVSEVNFLNVQNTIDKVWHAYFTFKLTEIGVHGLLTNLC